MQVGAGKSQGTTADGRTTAVVGKVKGNEDGGAAKKDAYVVLGTELPEGDAAYVLTLRDRDAAGNRHAVRLWNAHTGRVYARDDARSPLSACPLSGVGLVFNDRNVWANRQLADRPREMRWDLDDVACWKPLFDAGPRRAPDALPAPSATEWQTKPTLLPLQRTLVRSARVICSGPAAPADNAAALADDMLCEALTQSGFLLDVKKSVALGAHAKALTSLLELPAAPPAATVERWLGATWKRPPPPAASAEGAELRTAFSLALRYVIVRRGGRDVATPPPEPPPAPPALERQHRDALRSLPGLRLWVATAPHAAATAAGSWAPFPPEPSAPLPLLADDAAKAGQLSGDLAVSFVQVLTHAVATQRRRPGRERKASRC